MSSNYIVSPRFQISRPKKFGYKKVNDNNQNNQQLIPHYLSLIISIFELLNYLYRRTHDIFNNNDNSKYYIKTDNKHNRDRSRSPRPRKILNSNRNNKQNNINRSTKSLENGRYNKNKSNNHLYNSNVSKSSKIIRNKNNNNKQSNNGINPQKQFVQRFQYESEKNLFDPKDNSPTERMNKVKSPKLSNYIHRSRNNKINGNMNYNFFDINPTNTSTEQSDNDSLSALSGENNNNSNFLGSKFSKYNGKHNYNNSNSNKYRKTKSFNNLQHNSSNNSNNSFYSNNSTKSENHRILINGNKRQHYNNNNNNNDNYNDNSNNKSNNNNNRYYQKRSQHQSKKQSIMDASVITNRNNPLRKHDPTSKKQNVRRRLSQISSIKKLLNTKLGVSKSTHNGNMMELSGIGNGSVISDNKSDVESTVAFDLLDHSKYSLEALMDIPSIEHFEKQLGTHNKSDLLKLSWDLIRTNEKCNDLLNMVLAMNQDLERTRGLEHMMQTVCISLDCSFSSLYSIEDNRKSLRCICTSDDIMDIDDIILDSHNDATLPGKVYKSGRYIKQSLLDNSNKICPEYRGFGHIYVLGIPVRDHRGTMIAVLICYRDHNTSPDFQESDIKTAQMLTSIASSTLRNIKMFYDIQVQKRNSSKILSVIDEMSGDLASNSYHTLIRKLLRKIRGLVTCQELDFWTIEGQGDSKIMTCQISQNPKLQNLQIPVSPNHILGQVAMFGAPVKIDNSKYDRRYTNTQLQFSPGESILVIPVRLEHETHPIAVIQAINKIPTHHLGGNNAHNKKYGHSSKYNNRRKSDRIVAFTENDKKLLETLAKSASVIIRNTEMFELIQGERAKNIALVSILRALQQKNDVTSMLNDATLCIHHALGCERVSIWFTNSEGNLDSLNVISQRELDPQSALVFNALAKYCAHSGNFINSYSVYQDEEVWEAMQDHLESDFTSLNNNIQPYRVHSASVLCVPISSGERVVGVIECMYKDQGEPFSEMDLGIVAAISNEVAHTIARNVSDLALQRYIENHDDVPLDVIDYYLTGSHDRQDTMTSLDDDKYLSINEDEEIDDEYIIDKNGNKKKLNSLNKKTHSRKDSKGIKHYMVTLPNELIQYVHELDTCAFDACNFSREDLEYFTLYALMKTGLVDEFQLDTDKLNNFVNVVSKNYQNNPFHNWQHGFFVFHFVYYFINENKNILNNIVRRIDLLAILIAGLCHDIDHPGNDNLFEINSDTELARIYNGESVLENHHCYTTMSLLRKNDYNFLSTLNKQTQKDLKKTIVKCILTTDMSHHMTSIEWLRDMFQNQTFNRIANDKDMKQLDKQNNIRKICQCIVHLGDLSAQTYPWEIAKRWEDRIAQEFYNQTQKEEKLKLPVREFMKNTDIPSRYKSQTFFISHVVQPLWDAAAQLWPKMNQRLKELRENRTKYQNIANTHKENKNGKSDKD